jgi:hypothetical protein
MAGWQTTELSPSMRPRAILDRLRVLQGNGLGAVQDAPRADTDAQRHDARSTGAADVVVRWSRFSLSSTIFWLRTIGREARFEMISHNSLPSRAILFLFDPRNESNITRKHGSVNMDSKDSLRMIAGELRRLADASYGKPVRVPVTADTLREFASRLESIASADAEITKIEQP